MTQNATSGNPFFEAWKTPEGVTPFDRITPEHFREAFQRALAEHEAEVAAIAANPSPADFDNTIAALELSGRALDRANNAFQILAGAHTNDALLELERDVSPQIARHWHRIHTNAALFRRIDTRDAARPTRLGLMPSKSASLERHHTSFRRSGAALDDAAKERLAAIIERLAVLGTAFSQNVLADEQAFTLHIKDEAELAGLPDFMREVLRSEARERGVDGYVVTLSRSSVEPFLQFADRRDLREKVFRGFILRGDNGGATDNKAIIAETVRLRAERAQLLGYADFAHYRLDDAMAKTPAAVRELLDTVWRPARKSALADRDAMQDLIAEEGGNFKLAPWDWRYYAEKLRHRTCEFDETAIKPYLELDRIIEAAFYTAGRLFGLSFAPRTDVPVWHPDVRVWEVTIRRRQEDRPLLRRLFRARLKAQRRLDDAAARPAKARRRRRAAHRQCLQFQQGGRRRADTVELRRRAHAVPRIRPRLARPSVRRHLSDDCRHQRRHRFRRAAVAALRALAAAARNPAALCAALPDRRADAGGSAGPPDRRAQFQHGLYDAGIHLLRHRRYGFPSRCRQPDEIDPAAFENQSLTRIGMPDEIVMRHRPPHFGHVFSGGGYAAGYYSYMWSEVLDADAFAAFEETGDIFDPRTAKRLHDAIYAAGGSQEPAEAYKAFRGRLPSADALLQKRGFATSTAAS